MTQKRPRSGVSRTQPQDLKPGVTAQIQTTADTARSFSEDEYTDQNGTEAQRCFIRVITNNAIYAYGTDPLGLANAYPVNADGEINLDSPSKIKDFQLANATAGQQITFIYTMFFPN